MKKWLFLTICMFMAFAGCKKFDIAKGAPTCLKQTIKDQRRKTCDQVIVREYIFQEKTIYVVDSGACGADVGSKVVDTHCNYIGYLGGFTGNSVINGEEFSNATFIRTIWED